MTSSHTVYRVQPIDAVLHGVQTETSNGQQAGGVHVFESIDQLAHAILHWAPVVDIEIATIECLKSDLRDNHDYEGWLLPVGRGRIVARQPFADLDSMRSHFSD